jgi:flagellar hook-length control protein FliK
MPPSPESSAGTGPCEKFSVESTSLQTIPAAGVAADETAALSFTPPARGTAGEQRSRPTPQWFDDALLDSTPPRSTEADITAMANAANASTLAPTFDLWATIAAAGDAKELTAAAVANPPPLEGDTNARDADLPLLPNDLSTRAANATDAAPPRNEGARPAPSVAAQIHEQFSAHLPHLREHGRVEMRMDLHPPELGRMRLHLTMQDNELHVRMLVENDGAKRVLDQQIEPLRVRFAEMGVNLGQLDVRRDGGEPPQDQAHQAENSAETPLAWRAGNRHMRNGYVRVVHPDALVDVIA